ncbi:hypothetical protein Daura_39260 [Dactylosporangium aurantiacum]|uniref:Uncharacterized protein n=1 Tax=Dactylosporangium aurantiacum TaxID=35754 RepID=A0A9Q9IAV6_9ACTN|nr:hypothetical protein [Dactylosporangium aurantiacum]MDG6101537.1 hypothetical protein [Dactylosporangium aurantiacum]UWZ52622.1 hypothetical protein Daura_39260 [Dactylosporangium aurantiacum]
MSGRYRGAVLEDFTDAAVARLVKADRVGFWRTSRHAPDELVDRLADRIAASPPATVRRYGTPPGLDTARVELLLGADTDRALTHLTRLAHGSRVVTEMCEARGVWVPADGPARRRYVQQSRTIVTARQGDPRLATFVEPATVFADPRGLGCALPLAVPLLVGAALLPPPVRGDGHPFVMSHCAECDADEELRGRYGWRAGQFDEARDESCPGYPPDGEPERLRLRLAPAGERRWDDVGRLGGRPGWSQAHPRWLGCCGRPMWFVGELRTGEFGGAGGTIHGFRCECGYAAQTRRTT